MPYTPHPTDLARLEHMVERCRELLGASGCRLIRREGKAPHFGGTHLHGACRAGDDPTTSVVDAWGRVHGVDNLYVIDGGFMPYPGGVNPTLTIQANALRCARRMAQERWSVLRPDQRRRQPSAIEVGVDHQERRRWVAAELERLETARCRHEHAPGS